jgi:hypothetical protein
MQTELTQPGELLSQDGSLAQIGWARQPLLDSNLEYANFYRLKAFQRFRIKKWDYYAVFSPRSFFSATIADLGYAGNIFVYAMDLETGSLHEEGLVIPLSKGIDLPRNSTEGSSHFENEQACLDFNVSDNQRKISVTWPKFHDGKGIKAEISLDLPPGYESMTIAIPIGNKRFYYNRKINCLPASGTIEYGEKKEILDPKKCIGSLDWGRGVWDYQSYWNWASSSGFMPDRRTIGLNLGCGFGDLSKANENALILGNRIHKLGEVKFEYTPSDYMKPWRFIESEGRLSLDFIPFKERIAKTNLGIIFSEVHQMFGRFSGTVTADDGEIIPIKDLIGFAEEHHARW